MQIPLLAGISVDSVPALRVAYPVNLVPVPGQDGIADGQLRPAEGITSFTVGQGNDRGARFVPTGSAGGAGGFHYRVSGTKLISVSSTGLVTVIGDVGGTGPVKMDYSFDRLGVLSGGLLFYWDGTTFSHVTNVNVPANLIDMIWVDGYWMVTDGVVIAVSNLTDPTTFNPLKFGGTDRPDPIQGLSKVKNEPWVVSRNFADVFQNAGTALFPFQRINEAVITKGAIGTHAQCVFNDSLAFLGGGLDETVSIYLARNAVATPIATLEIARLLAQYTEAQLAGVVMEALVDEGAQLLFVRLPDRTIVYDGLASAAAQQPVWHQRVSAIAGFAPYRACNFVRAFDAWYCGDPLSNAIGKLNATDSQHYGADVRWEFSTPMLRNGSKGAIIHELELTALTGAVPAGKDPTISTSFSTDGKVFSQDRTIKSGKIGDTEIRLIWLALGIWRKWRIHRFRGDSSSRLTALFLDATIEALAF